MTVPGPEAIAAADDPLAPIAERLFQPLGIEGVYARTASRISSPANAMRAPRYCAFRR